MFGFFRRRNSSSMVGFDLERHINAAQEYILEKTSLSELVVRFSLNVPVKKTSVSESEDSVYGKAQAYLNASQKKTSFHEMILTAIDDQGMTPKEFYSRAGLDRKLFSAIKKGGSDYQPSRNTAIRCCFALRLPIERTEEFLKAAGYALSDTKRQDLIIRYCIENKIWNLFDVDELLDALGESILFK